MPEGLIKNARIVNEGRIFEANILIRGDKIDALIMPGEPLPKTSVEIIDAGGRMVIPGIIDDQVHFREPGLTHKGDIRSESRAAVAGGVTSYMEMPNTLPQTITIAELERKNKLASGKSLANFGFYLGATNDNLAEDIHGFLNREYAGGPAEIPGSHICRIPGPPCHPLRG